MFKFVNFCYLFLTIAAASSSHCEDYKIDVSEDSDGKDTRARPGEFNMLWIWIVAASLFFIGILISIVRDIVPRPPRGDTEDRYSSGESKQIIRFFLEEYLVTGWLFTKLEPRFSVTARWCLIFSIIFTEMLITGALYKNDSRSAGDYDKFKDLDIGYSVVSTAIAFIAYLVAYGLLVTHDNNSSGAHRYRRCFGYFFAGILFGVTTIFVFVFTYQMNDNHDDNYSGLVTNWMKAFGLSLLLEMLVSENIRITTTAILIWAHRYDPEDPLPTSIEMTVTDRYQRHEKQRLSQDEYYD
ncbi:unnamed protein product [Blepharisma stoltei]|uniref:Uncharacterized protein n=1 Tax=Blepharisma stoltei TaxID=1481888 RepID=A0AAU9IXC6_9CILI|nr:unnamed protein product [Blepharisma stoltei]